MLHVNEYPHKTPLPSLLGESTLVASPPHHHRTNLDDNLCKNREKYHHGTADTDPQSHFRS